MQAGYMVYRQLTTYTVLLSSSSWEANGVVRLSLSFESLSSKSVEKCFTAFEISSVATPNDFILLNLRNNSTGTTET